MPTLKNVAVYIWVSHGPILFSISVAVSSLFCSLESLSVSMQNFANWAWESGIRLHVYVLTNIVLEEEQEGICGLVLASCLSSGKYLHILYKVEQF